MAQLFEDLQPNRGLPFDHIGVVERRQEMPAGLRAIALRGRQRIVEIVPGQTNLDLIAAKTAGFVDLLLGRGDRHENRALHPEMPTGIGHTLRVVASAGTDKGARVGRSRQRLAHRIESAADLVAAHGRDILAL